MTVCVATISKDGYVIGASDRMLTVGDMMSFSPPVPKIDPFTNSIVVLYSGDTAMHTEVMARSHSVLSEQLRKEPNKWVSVEWIAKVYQDTYLRVRAARAAASILAPLDLTPTAFLEKSDVMGVPLVDRIRTDLNRFAAVGGVDAIIAGIDEAGPMLFRIANGSFSDEGKLGFATVGNGGQNAAYELMLASYSRETLADAALLHTYVVKRRAEVAPFVGSATDMFVMGPLPGTFKRVEEKWLAHLSKIYRRMVRRENRAFEKAATETSDWLAELGRQQAKQKPPSQSPPSSPTPLPPSPEPPREPSPESTHGK